MSKVFIRYEFEEIQLFPDGSEKTFCDNLPHEKEIREEVEKDFNEAHLEQYFDGVLKDNIASCTMKCKTEDAVLVGIITIEAKPGFVLSEKRRNAIFDQMDGQLCDGWGEGFFGYGNVFAAEDGTRYIVE